MILRSALGSASSIRVHRKPALWWVLPLAVALLVAACSGPAEHAESAALLTIGDRSVSVGEFKEALEMAKTAYPPGVANTGEGHLDLCRRVLRETIETAILEETAADLGIFVSEEELHEAVSEIKADYPEGGFDRMLVDSAVPYSLWEKRLRQRVLMQKVIDALLGPPPEVTMEDIAALLQEAPDLVDEAVPSGEDFTESETLLIGMVREEKRRIRYRKWLEAEIQRRRIEVSPSRWEAIVGRSDG